MYPYTNTVVPRTSIRVYEYYINLDIYYILIYILYIILYCIILYHIMLYYIVLHYIILHYVILYYIILHYIMLHMSICIYVQDPNASPNGRRGPWA